MELPGLGYLKYRDGTFRIRISVNIEKELPGLGYLKYRDGTARIRIS